MRKLFLVTLILIVNYTVKSQQTAPDAHYKLITGKSFVQAKNYYLFTLLQHDDSVRKMLEKDTLLAAIAKNKLSGLSAAKDCGHTVACFTGRMQFSDQEISDISSRLSALYNDNNPLGKLVHQHLIPSGTYILFKNLSPAELLVKAWEQDECPLTKHVLLLLQPDKA
jgi:hypothetical protein